MKTGPIKLCWLDLGDGTVCECLLGHEPPCSADPSVDFPITITSSVGLRLEFPDPNWLHETLDTGFSGTAIRARLADDSPTWHCPHCAWPPSQNDIANRYCGHCHHFCEDIVGGS